MKLSVRLYYHPLCPFSRKVRLALWEKEATAELVEIDPWKREEEFYRINHACEVPVLEHKGYHIADSRNITEYLDEILPQNDLIGVDLLQRVETRRLMNWFDIKFRREVTDLLWGERVMKRLKRDGTPDSFAIRAGLANLRHHLAYIAYLFDQRRWLAGDSLSYADLTAAAHLSVLDYLGDVPWSEQPAAREWYAKTKSRPSFRPLLQDKIAIIKPASHYDDLDFE